jgi:hypothetical protein
MWKLGLRPEKDNINGIFVAVCTTAYRKEGNRVGQMQSLLGQMQTRQAELAAAQHLISYFSSPCFSLKIVDNFGWTRQEHMLEKYE